MKGEERVTRSWRWTNELIVLAGSTRPELVAEVRDLEAALRARPGVRLRDAAWTTAKRLDGGGSRLGLVVDSVDDALRKLAYARERLEDPSCERVRDRSGIFFFEEPLGRTGGLALLFPGEGSQYPWMLSELCLHFPEVRRVMDLADRAFLGHARGYLPSRLIYPRAGDDGHGGGDGAGRLFAMDGAVEAVFAANLALARLLERFAVRPDVVVGHSTGDYAALLVSGGLAVSGDDHLVEIMRRLNSVYEALGREDGVPHATLLAVGLGRRDALDRALAASGGELTLAIDNCPHQFVVCGPPAAIGAGEEALRAHGAVLERLPFDRPYHTARFKPVCGPLGELFATLSLQAPSTPLWSCATAAPVPADVEALRELTVAQWMAPVRFRETVEALFDHGIRLFVEAGPRGGLSAFVADTLRGRPHAALPVDLPRAPGIRQLLHLLAQLFAHEVEIDLEPLFHGRGCREVALGEAADPAPPPFRLESTLPALHFGGDPPALNGPSRRGSTPEDRPAGVADSEPPGEGLQGPGLPGCPQVPVESDDRVMEELFRINEMLLESQKRIVLAYLAQSSGDAEGGATRVPADLGAPASAGSPVPEHEDSAALSSPPAPARDTTEPGVTETLLELVAERTGYPPEMLTLDANLEADLGIDSIKRVEILGALRQRVGNAPRLEDPSGFRTLGEIAEAFSGGEAAEAPDGEVEPSFAGRVRVLEPGHRVVLRRRVDLEEDLWLRDHTLGSDVSLRDPELLALPVVMLTMAVEMMAQAAALLVPGATVTRVTEVRARRFLALRGDHLDLEIEAECAEGGSPERVRVALSEVGPETGEGPSPGASILTASVELAPEYPEPGEAREISLDGARPSRFLPRDLYTRVMFHGPRLQGVEAVRAWAQGGAEIELRGLPVRDLFRSVPEPVFLTDPVLLDAAGQVVGFWTAEHFRSGFVVFPFQVDEIALFGPAARPGERLRCRASIELLGDALVRADFQVTGADGRLRLRVSGWQDKRIAISEEFFRFRFAPGDVVLSQAVDEADPARGVRLRFGDRLMESEGGAWRDGLAHLTLSRRERREWNALGVEEGARTAWLLARVAAKDAVRRHVAGSGGARLRPADVEIEGPASGVVEAHAAGLRGSFEVRVLVGSDEAEAVLVDPSDGPFVGVDPRRVDLPASVPA